jgi:8-oxo-dGTP diphosphatase
MDERGVVRVVSAEIQRDGHYLLTQRSARAVLPLLWEFPGGRVREGETDEQALARAVLARVGIVATIGPRLLEVEHDYDSYRVVMAVYRASLRDAEPFAMAVHAIAWVRPEDFADYPFPGADQKTVSALLREL